MRFLINFLKALTVFLGYGLCIYLVFELLKPYNISPWIPFGLVVACLCALAALIACYVEGKK